MIKVQENEKYDLIFTNASYRDGACFLWTFFESY